MVRLDPLEEDMGQTTPQTEDAEERGFVDEPDDEHRGEADGLDPDGAGDIADEGSAHRG